MYYVQANYHYYPEGGFRDIRFKGNYEDCCFVADLLKKKDRYDKVEVVDDDGIVTNISHFE